MNEIIINPNNLKEDEVLQKEKARAILFDENNRIIVGNYNNLYLLPGGKIDKNESIKEGLTRELQEELGITFTEENLEYFMTLKHFQKDFPSRKDDSIDRLVTIHFYTGFLSIDLKTIKNNLSLNEQKANFYLEYINIDDLENLILTYKISNPRAPFFDTELLTVLFEINKKENLKRRIRSK